MYDEDSCNCVHTPTTIPACDDGICLNGLEFYDTSICECVTTEDTSGCSCSLDLFVDFCVQENDLTASAGFDVSLFAANQDASYLSQDHLDFVWSDGNGELIPNCDGPNCSVWESTDCPQPPCTLSFPISVEIADPIQDCSQQYFITEEKFTLNGFEWENVEINEETIWVGNENEDPDYVNAVIVNPGATLRLVGHNLLVKDRIVVMPGARLIVENGSTLSGGRCTQRWAGIFVAGSPSAESILQPDEWSMNNYTEFEYGIVELHSAVVKDASTAINFFNYNYSAEEVLKINDLNDAGNLGAGYLYANRTIFRDNTIAINFPEALASSNSSSLASELTSVISECTFLITARYNDLSSYDFNSSSICTHIKMRPSIANRAEIYSNLFSNAIDTYVIGVRADNSTIHTFKGNNFEDLYYGVMLSGVESIAIHQNIFENQFKRVVKGITAIGLFELSIIGNSFDLNANLADLPVNPIQQIENIHNSGAESSYAIYSKLCRAEISRNVIRTNMNNDRFGLVIDNSGSAETPPGGEILENYFEGNFVVATQFQGVNDDLILNCNAYSACDIDWRLTEGSSLRVQGGNCDLELPEVNKSFSNSWHTIDPLDGTKHILNEGAGLELRCDQVSLPDLVEGPVLVVNCFLTNQSNQINPDCTQFYDHLPDDIESGPVGIEDESSGTIGDVTEEQDNPCVRYLSSYGVNDPKQLTKRQVDQIIRKFTKVGQKTDALEFLKCLEKEWADWVLVNSYIDKARTADAITRLDRINIETEEQQIRRDLALARINKINSSSSGKWGGLKDELLDAKRHADSELAKARSEAALSALFATHYDQVPIPLYRTEEHEENEHSCFTVHPNPANHYTIIDMRDNLLGTTSIELFSTDGVLLKRFEIVKEIPYFYLPLQHLEEGCYFLRFSNDTFTCSQKLLIHAQ